MERGGVGGEAFAARGGVEDFGLGTLELADDGPKRFGGVDSAREAELKGATELSVEAIGFECVGFDGRFVEGDTGRDAELTSDAKLHGSNAKIGVDDEAKVAAADGKTLVLLVRGDEEAGAAIGRGDVNEIVGRDAEELGMRVDPNEHARSGELGGRAAFDFGRRRGGKRSGAERKKVAGGVERAIPRDEPPVAMHGEKVLNDVWNVDAVGMDGLAAVLWKRKTEPSVVGGRELDGGERSGVETKQRRDRSHRYQHNCGAAPTRQRTHESTMEHRNSSCV